MGSGRAMPVTRREQATWRRDQIIDAAMSVFGGKGIDAASMKEVAAVAGVTPGLLYHYFASKEALVLTVVAERGFLPELRRLLSAAGQRPASVVLPEILRDFRRLLEGRSQLVGLFLSGAGTNPKIRAGLQEVVGEGHQLLSEYLAGRVAAGELREHDTGTVAQMLLASCVVGHVIGRPVSPDSVTDVLLRGLEVG